MPLTLVVSGCTPDDDPRTWPRLPVSENQRPHGALLEAVARGVSDQPDGGGCDGIHDLTDDGMSVFGGWRARGL